MTRFLAGLLALLLSSLKLVPRAFYPALATLLAGVIRPFAGKDLARLRSNVQRIYALPPESHFSKMFEKQVFRHQLLCALETMRAIQSPEVLTVTGFEEWSRLIKAAEDVGKGHIVVTAHLGSWELCAYFGQKAALKPFHVLAKPAKSAAVTAFLDGLRSRMGTRVLWTDKKSLLRDMLKALRSGESVGFVMDQKPEGRQGPLVEFLGLPTEFVSGPAQMTVKTGCAAFSVFCVREGAFRYRLVSQALVPPGHAETDEAALTQRMADVITGAIRLYPEQWTWNYKRWRDPQPAGGHAREGFFKG